MRTFSTITLGCKVNQYESQQIRELLEKLGLRQVEADQKPDMVIVNTCCVTHTASAKSRQYIRRALNTNPKAAVVVCGCLPRANTDEINGIGANIYLISRRQELAACLRNLPENRTTADHLARSRHIQEPAGSTGNRKTNAENKSENTLNLPQLTSFKGHTRAFLKVQDGCDAYCTYCIVPRTRPVVRSKPPQAALNEARILVEAGHREIVITGVYLGAYGQQTVKRKNWPNQQNDHLADLIDKMAEIPGLERIRLSSLEPADTTIRLIETFARHANIMPHLHLSLQSGSDAVLRRMARKYTADEFREKVDLINSRLDRPAITTDIIVGFPGETDADFEQTVKLAEEVGFARIHVFAFSPRKGTAAAKMPDAVAGSTIKERSMMLRTLTTKLSRHYRRQFIGETANILLESDNGQICGHSERYFTVCLRKTQKKPKKGEILRVKLLQNSQNGLIGEALYPLKSEDPR